MQTNHRSCHPLGCLLALDHKLAWHPLILSHLPKQPWHPSTKNNLVHAWHATPFQRRTRHAISWIWSQDFDFHVVHTIDPKAERSGVKHNVLQLEPLLHWVWSGEFQQCSGGTAILQNWLVTKEDDRKKEIFIFFANFMVTLTMPFPCIETINATRGGSQVENRLCGFASKFSIFPKKNLYISKY